MAIPFPEGYFSPAQDRPWQWSPLAAGTPVILTLLLSWKKPKFFSNTWTHDRLWCVGVTWDVISGRWLKPFCSFSCKFSFPISFHVSFSAHSSSWASVVRPCVPGHCLEGLCAKWSEKRSFAGRSKSFFQMFFNLPQIIKREWIPLLQRGRQHSFPWNLNCLFLVVKPGVTCLCLFSELEPRPVCVPGKREWVNEGVVL